jgi:hypothetical protein
MMARVQFVRDRRNMRCASLLILPVAESGGSGSGGVGARARTWTVREWNCRTTSRDEGLVVVLVLAVALYCLLGRI